MTLEQIKRLIESNGLPGGESLVLIHETHISWVLMTTKFAFKIKKSLQFSFLDFSTLEKRKFYCQRELALNQRLAPEIYLNVLPIRSVHNKLLVGEGKGDIVDYCVQMKRMQADRQMSILLKQNALTKKHVKQIAQTLADFHQNTEIITDAFSGKSLANDFADILQSQDFYEKYLGKDAALLIKESVTFSDAFLKNHAERMEWRNAAGFTRDCHGDLHSGNIFILDEPIIFDCIEFNDAFRQIDILNELAFFCMDLEFYKHGDLSKHFIQEYLKMFPCLFSQEDQRLFLYYKYYRCNIKIKVNAIKAKQAESKEVFERRLSLVKRYFQLFMTYHQKLSNEQS